MGLFQSLFSATRNVIALPNFDAGNKAVNISTTILHECINAGFAGPGEPNRPRLVKPFARGYLFGFSDACVQRLGVLDDLESLALVTMIHTEIFGQKIGSLLVGDALRDQRDAEFGRGRFAGAEDFFRCLNDRSYAPQSLTGYLLADDTPSSLMAPAGETRAVLEAASAESAMTIPLHTKLHLKAIKPIKH